MTYLGMELRRGLKSVNFMLSCILCLIFFCFGYWANQLSIQMEGGLLLFYSAILFGSGALLTVFAPIVATLPYSASFLQDKKHHFLWGVLNRMSIKRYWLTKFVVVGILGAAALMVPLVLLLIVNLIFWGHGHVDAMGLSGPFWNLYTSKQDLLFAIVLIIHSGLFGWVYAEMGLVVSLFVDRVYAVVGIPFVLYLAPSFVLPFLDLSRFEPSTTFAMNLVSDASYWSVYGELFGLLGVIILAMIYRIRRDQKWVS